MGAADVIELLVCGCIVVALPSTGFEVDKNAGDDARALQVGFEPRKEVRKVASGSVWLTETLAVEVGDAGCADKPMLTNPPSSSANWRVPATGLTLVGFPSVVDLSLIHI